MTKEHTDAHPDSKLKRRSGSGSRRGRRTVPSSSSSSSKATSASASSSSRRRRNESGSSVAGAAANPNSDEDDIASYIPPYLQRFITPHHGDFCFTRLFHHRLVAQCMAEGFLPIATEGILLPKLHRQRCVIPLPRALHISKSVRKKSKRFAITINQEFDRVVQGCQVRHGRHCWLYPPLVQAFRTILEADHVDTTVINGSASTQSGNLTAVSRQQQPRAQSQQCPVRLYSIEVWDVESNELVGGELGYTVGSIYTSLTGFSTQDSAGSVQLAALGRLLCQLGFSLWDLGMEMDYKTSLGSTAMPRREFVEHVHAVRCNKGDLVLPQYATRRNAKDIIDYEQVQVQSQAQSRQSSQQTDSSQGDKPLSNKAKKRLQKKLRKQKQQQQQQQHNNDLPTPNQPILQQRQSATSDTNSNQKRPSANCDASSLSSGGHHATPRNSTNTANSTQPSLLSISFSPSKHKHDGTNGSFQSHASELNNNNSHHVNNNSSNDNDDGIDQSSIHEKKKMRNSETSLVSSIMTARLTLQEEPFAE